MVKATKRPYRFWAEYARHCANQLGLSEWEVSVDKYVEDGPDDPCVAEAIIEKARHAVCIHLGKRFMKHTTEDEQRLTIVHELIHCHLYQVEMHLDMAFSSYPEKDMITLLKAEHHRAIEFATEDMAMAWAPHIMMPIRFAAKRDFEQRPLPPQAYQYTVTSQTEIVPGQGPLAVEDRGEAAPVTITWTPAYAGNAEDNLRPIQPNGVNYPSGRG